MDALNFQRIADAYLETWLPRTDPRWPSASQELADALHRVWNARGAADVAELEHELATLMGATMAGPYIKNLQRALRALDRR